jgi:MFS family permease
MGIRPGTATDDSAGDAVEKAPPSRRLLALEALKITNFRFLVAADFFGLIGFNTRLMVQGWVVLELTNSDGWVGLVAGLPAIPVIALALFGGAIADRVNRRVLQIWTFTLLASTGFVLGLLIETDSLQLWHLIAISFPVGLLSALRMTAGAAMVVDVVGRDRIFGANALNAALQNVGRFLGPAAGGWVLANHGAGIAFHGIGVLLLASAGLMWFVRVENPIATDPKKTLFEDFKSGLRYISATPELRWLAVLAVSVSAHGMTLPLIPRWTRDVLGAGPEGYGFILAAGGVGGLIGAIALIAAPSYKQLAKGLVIIVAIYSTAVVAFAFTNTLWTAAIAYAIVGGTIAWWASTMRTLFQLAARDEMRGRVMSLVGLISQTIAFGWLVGGALSELVGPQSTFIIAGITVFAIYLFAYLRSPELRQIGQ